MTLTEQQARVYKLLLGAGLDVDVFIASIFAEMKSVSKVNPTLRDKQHHVGAMASRLNKKIEREGHKIVPGQLKHTYRLTALIERNV